MPPGPSGVVETGPASATRTAVALVLFLCVIALALLPVAVASGAAGEVVEPLAAWLGALAVVVGGVKLTVAAWGLVERVLERLRHPALAASLD